MSRELEVGEQVRMHGGGAAVVHDVWFTFDRQPDGSERARPVSVALRCAGCGRDFAVSHKLAMRRKRIDCRGCAREARAFS